MSGPLVRNMWLILLIPCTLVLLYDLTKPQRPQFSMTHVFFIVVVVRPSTCSLA
jgi:hypothetical protein